MSNNKPKVAGLGIAILLAIIGVVVFTNPNIVGGLFGAAIELEDGPVSGQNETFTEVFTFSANELRYQGEAIRANNSIVLPNGSAQLGPNVPMAAGTWRVTIHGNNLSTQDLWSAAQLDPYILLDIKDVESNGDLLTYILIIPEDVESLELFYMNTQDSNVVINKITVKR